MVISGMNSYFPSFVPNTTCIENQRRPLNSTSWNCCFAMDIYFPSFGCYITILVSIQLSVIWSYQGYTSMSNHPQYSNIKAIDRCPVIRNGNIRAINKCPVIRNMVISGPYINVQSSTICSYQNYTSISIHPWYGDIGDIHDLWKSQVKSDARHG